MRLENYLLYDQLMLGDSVLKITDKDARKIVELTEEREKKISEWMKVLLSRFSCGSEQFFFRTGCQHQWEECLGFDAACVAFTRLKLFQDWLWKLFFLVLFSPAILSFRYFLCHEIFFGTNHPNFIY